MFGRRESKHPTGMEGPQSSACGGGCSEEHLRDIAREIKQSLSPRTVIDMGTDGPSALEAFRDQGMEVFLPDPSCPYTGEDPPATQCRDTRYDLALCLDSSSPRSSLAHARRHVRDLARHSDSILFSCPADPRSAERPSCYLPREWWISLFEEIGYLADVSCNSSLVSESVLLFKKRKNLDHRLHNPMRILVVSPDIHNACGEVRLIRPLSYLRDSGLVQVRLFPGDRTYEDIVEEHLDWPDLLILQRIKSNRWKPLVKKARDRGIRIVYEIDDNLMELPKTHPAFKSSLSQKARKSRYVWFLENAEAVTCSTVELALYLKKFHDRVFLLRNYIDPHAFETGRSRDILPHASVPRPFTIGYGGTFSHARDLREPIKALKSLNPIFKDRMHLCFLGYVPLELAKEPNFSCDARMLPYEYYLREIGSRGFDLALAPLEDNLFNRCKSNMKFLEYSFSGIPAIYSKVSPYNHSIQDGVTGILVAEDTEDAWRETLRRILEDHSALPRISSEAHRFVNDLFLLKDHYMEWWDTYVNILENWHRDK